MFRLAAERQLTSLESFIQECLQIMMAMNCHVAQQLLNHLQDVTGGDQAQQPVKPPHPQGHSSEVNDDSVS